MEKDFLTIKLQYCISLEPFEIEWRDHEAIYINGNLAVVPYSKREFDICHVPAGANLETVRGKRAAIAECDRLSPQYAETITDYLEAKAKLGPPVKMER